MMDQATYHRLTGQLVPQQRATTNIVRSTTPKVRSAFKARENGKKIYHRLPNKYGVKLTTLPKRTTRPLNSFFAFRAYYAKIFKGLQQKDNSPFLSKLWEHDPFKAKWAILAKAYSTIRDQKDVRDPDLLQKFLKINAGFVEMVTPEVYLQTLGWTFVVDTDGRTTLHQHLDNTGSFDRNLFTTNKSVDDVVENSVKNGLGKGNGVEQEQSETIVMASSSQSSAHKEPIMEPEYRPYPTVTMDQIDTYMGQYPHNLAFDPLAHESFVWDPFSGDEFDAFHISSMEDLTSDGWMQHLFQ